MKEIGTINKRFERTVIKEEDFQAIPPTIRDKTVFCRVIRKQKAVSTACLALKFRVSKLK